MTSLSGPVDDGAWTPAVSGNQLALEGTVVVKRYGTRLGAFARETALLARFDALADPLPVPRPLPPRVFGELRYACVPGVSGVEALAGGLATRVCAEMGAFLRRLHRLAPDPFDDVLPGAGPVVAHGDFAPQNVIVDGATGALLAVLDWEEARRDIPALDLAWCEAQVLGRFPQLRWAMRHLFEAYGEAPGPAERERALEARLAHLNARAQGEVNSAPARQPGVLYRRDFSSAREAAAFAAALSRVLAGPAGRPYRVAGTEPLVWAADDGRAMFLTEAALRATTERFGAAHAVAVALADVPASSRLLYGAGRIPEWGADTAHGILTDRSR